MQAGGSFLPSSEQDLGKALGSFFGSKWRSNQALPRIPSLKQSSLHPYQVPGTGETVLNIADKLPALMECIWCEAERQDIS